MGASRWPVVGMIAAGVLATGGCAGAVVGHFTVTGGLTPGAGWQMPSFGTDEAIAALPPAAATVRAIPEPSFVGYYPAQATDVPDPAMAEAAARDFDALYDEPAFEAATFAEPVLEEATFEAAVRREPEPTGAAETAYREPVDAAD